VIQFIDCRNCNEPIEADHATDEHPGLCCDCFDSLFFGLEAVNAERAAKGKKPIARIPDQARSK
jgi:hypothetical protein